jgi:hypothetical protein
MKNRHSNILGKMLLPLFLAATFISTATAQTTEAQVIVSGPWAYVEDPKDSSRVVIIAAASLGHLGARIFSGPDDNDEYKRFPDRALGVYRLDIATGQCPGSAATVNPAKPYRIPEAGQPNITAAVIAKAINGKAGQRYAVSLPKPCSYESKGTALAKISPSQITTTAAATKGDSYTTSMVLHYKVSTSTPAKLTSTPDQGSASSESLPFQSNVISIVLASSEDAERINGPECDSVSAMSFVAQTRLFLVSRYIWVPNDQGTFKDQCKLGPNISGLEKQFDLGLSVMAQVTRFQEAAKNRAAGQDLSGMLDRISTDVKAFKPDALLVPRKTYVDAASYQRMVDEIRAAKTELKNEPRVRPMDKQRNEHSQDQAATKLTETQKYFSALFSPGTGDCRGSQTGINGIP